MSKAKAMLAKPQQSQTYPPALPTNTSVSGKGIAQGGMSFAPIVSEYYLPQQINQNGAQSAANYMYQQVYELSQKRIKTLQYMRRA